MDDLIFEAERLIERRDAEALTLANRLMQKAQLANSPRKLAQATYILAYYNCMVANDYDKAIELCEQSIKNTAAKELRGIDYKIYMTLGNAYQLKGEVFSAQHWYMKGLRLLENRELTSKEDQLFLATFYYNLSIIFTTRELNDSGEEYLQKAIKLYEQADSVFKLSKCYSAYASILEGRKEYKQAIELMRKALKLDLQGKDQYSIALSQANLGILLGRILLFGEATTYLEEALGFFEKESKPHEAALVQFNLGKIICEAGRFHEGIVLLEEAEKIFKQLDNKHELTNIYELLSSIMADKGSYKLALEYHHKYSQNVKYVFDSEKANALTRAKQEFETEQKEKEAILLREKNEEIRIYAANLEAANRDLEALSYSVSHDLKGPLAMIKNINSMNPEDENGYRKFIDDTCKQALASIDSILSFSENINKDLLSAQYKPEEVYTVIDEKLSELKPAAEKGNQTLVHIQPDKTLRAGINKDTFGRALDNLIRNSIKFSTGKGKITVEVFAENEHWIVIKVSDEGIGFPEELREHLFKKFSLAHREGLKGEKGTGLGLYITHSIIKLHGGTIEMDASQNKGTTFIIRLPLVQA